LLLVSRRPPIAIAIALPIALPVAIALPIALPIALLVAIALLPALAAPARASLPARALFRFGSFPRASCSAARLAVSRVFAMDWLISRQKERYAEKYRDICGGG
jgi:hypothetical protein